MNYITAYYNCNYSTIVPFISNDRILVLRSYRHLVDSIQVEAPSGYIEDGESPEQAARRELEEETGYTAKKIVTLGYYTLDYTMFEQKGNVFVAYGLDNKDKQSLGKMEKIVIDTITIKEIKRLLSQGKILNAASIVAFYKALDFHERHMMYNGVQTKEIEVCIIEYNDKSIVASICLV
jgi:ADP-ribose pyrophosphatase